VKRHLQCYFNVSSLLCFIQGKGSCLTIDGHIEMDASVMDGATLNGGGVACIRNVANPVKVARLVMEKVLVFITFFQRCLHLLMRA
jgi:isoaspartyl peptidase/L-asparaginase-like protein (Ntn-hydrolase superfamily)